MSANFALLILLKIRADIHLIAEVYWEVVNFKK